MARSLTDLQALAAQHGIEVAEGATRIQIMDALREKTGTFDPDVQIDPMKAVDLKNQIAWSDKDLSKKFAGIASYLNDGWVADAKLDGARMRLFLGGSGNTMNTGRRSDSTYAYIERADNFPHLRDLVVPDLAGTILDGEMMPPKLSLTTASGVTTKGSLNSIMALVNSSPAKAVATQKSEGVAVFVAFDVIAVNGEDVSARPLKERRQMLESIVQILTLAAAMSASHTTKPITVVPQMAATAENIQACLDQGMEGVILKRIDSAYEAGKRSRNWAKVKRMSTGDFVVFGSVPGKGRNSGLVGSMKVGYRDLGSSVTDDHGNIIEGLRYVADVAGITDAHRAKLTGTDGRLAPQHRGRVIEVQAQGRTKNDRLRHPLWVRDRPDKDAVDCDAACSIELFESV